MTSTTGTCYGIAPFGLLLAVLSSFLTSDQLATSARNVKQIVAHRGASSERPECTLAAISRAIEVGATAVEMDVRTSKDGVLFLLHDTTLDRTTDGKGSAAAMTISELKQLDAGSWFDPDYENERIPTLREALTACRHKIAPVLDLKEQGEAYAKHVAAEVREFGEPTRTIVGVRSVAQARQIRELLPEARQLGLIPNLESIEPFAVAGVETIRLWPRWLKDRDDLVPRVRKTKSSLHLNGRLGTLEEITPLLAHGPDSLSSDDPARLLQTLNDLAGEPKRLCFHRIGIALGAGRESVSRSSLRSGEAMKHTGGVSILALTGLLMSVVVPEPLWSPDLMFAAGKSRFECPDNPLHR